VFKFGLALAVGRKGVARMGLPLGLEREHFAGIVKNGCGGVFLGTCPLCVSKRAERRRFFSNADIAGHEIGLLEWDIKLRFISELDRKHLVFTDSLQSLKSSGPHSVQPALIWMSALKRSSGSIAILR